MLIAESPGVRCANSVANENAFHFCPAVRFPLRVREVVGSIPKSSTAFVAHRNSRSEQERKIRSSIILLIRTFILGQRRAASFHEEICTPARSSGARVDARPSLGLLQWYLASMTVPAGGAGLRRCVPWSTALQRLRVSRVHPLSRSAAAALSQFRASGGSTVVRRGHAA